VVVAVFFGRDDEGLEVFVSDHTLKHVLCLAGLVPNVGRRRVVAGKNDKQLRMRKRRRRKMLQEED